MAHPYFYRHEPTHNPYNYPKVLDVILVVSNTQRFESRYRLFKKTFEEMKRNSAIRLTVVEMAFGQRPHVVVDESHPRNLLLRNPDELWHKENMINLGIQCLPEDWQYLAWVDGDVTFLDNGLNGNQNWAIETVEALQHYAIIQPWRNAIDLGPNGETIAQFESFCACYRAGKIIKVKNRPRYYINPHPGFAWAARREAINRVGGMIDTAVLGSGDSYMAFGLIGRAMDCIPSAAHPGYRRPIKHWEDRALKYIKKNIGFIPNTIIHHFHGKKRDRRYTDRWEIFVKWQFNPDTDLVKDWQGLWRLRVDTDRQIGFRDALRDYTACRNEDSIDLE